jgi:hypothetical protein
MPWGVAERVEKKLLEAYKEAASRRWLPHPDQSPENVEAGKAVRDAHVILQILVSAVQGDPKAIALRKKWSTAARRALGLATLSLDDAPRAGRLHAEDVAAQIDAATQRNGRRGWRRRPETDKQCRLLAFTIYRALLGRASPVRDRLLEAWDGNDALPNDDDDDRYNLETYPRYRHACELAEQLQLKLHGKDGAAIVRAALRIAGVPTKTADNFFREKGD